MAFMLLCRRKAATKTKSYSSYTHSYTYPESVGQHAKVQFRQRTSAENRHAIHIARANHQPRACCIFIAYLPVLFFAGPWTSCRHRTLFGHETRMHTGFFAWFLNPATEVKAVSKDAVVEDLAVWCRRLMDDSSGTNKLYCKEFKKLESNNCIESTLHVVSFSVQCNWKYPPKGTQ